MKLDGFQNSLFIVTCFIFRTFAQIRTPYGLFNNYREINRCVENNICHLKN